MYQHKYLDNFSGPYGLKMLVCTGCATYTCCLKLDDSFSNDLAIVLN